MTKITDNSEEAQALREARERLAKRIQREQADTPKSNDTTDEVKYPPLWEEV